MVEKKREVRTPRCGSCKSFAALYCTGECYLHGRQSPTHPRCADFQWASELDVVGMIGDKNAGAITKEEYEKKIGWHLRPRSEK